MSTTQFTFKAKLILGDQVVPLTSEMVIGPSDAKDGVQQGFLFKLDLEPGQPAPVIPLGRLIAFVEDKLGAARIADNPALAAVRQALGLGASPFDATDTTVIAVKSFLVNSKADASLFSVSVDVSGKGGATGGILALPKELAGWLNVEDLAVSFSCSSASDKSGRAP